MNVTYIGHAAIMVETEGTRILMDPWLTDPTYHGTWFHYPPLTIGVRDLPPLDYIYISHEHPDHFDPPTLRQIDKNVPILIANFKNKKFRQRFESMGFRDIRELDFGASVPLNDRGTLARLVPPDRPWDDSAILLRDSTMTLFNANDCHLDDDTLEKLGQSEQIDLAFLTFTGASQYPGCFEFPIASKIARWQASKQAHAEEFVSWAKLLRAKRVVPAAGNFALLARDQLFLNTSHYVNTPQDAIDALEAATSEVEGLQMNPGDVWSPDAGLRRRNPPPDWGRRLEHIEEMSRESAGRIAEYFASEEPAPPDLCERFQTYFHRVISANLAAAAKVGIVTWWRVTGDHGGDWCIDFRRDRDWVTQGVPSEWNLRLTMSDTLVHLGVSEQAKWENLVLSFRVRLARNPDHYMKDFWTWFCKL